MAGVAIVHRRRLPEDPQAGFVFRDVAYLYDKAGEIVHFIGDVTPAHRIYKGVDLELNREPPAEEISRVLRGVDPTLDNVTAAVCEIYEHTFWASVLADWFQST